MSNVSTFPILDVNANQITSIDGNVSNFYKLQNPDIEQFHPIQIENYLSAISSCLNNLSQKKYYKFYRLGDESFVDTNDLEISSLAGINFSKCNKPLYKFFKGSEIFSDIAIFDDYISYNGEFLRIFSVKSFSEDEANSYLIPDGVDYVLFIKKMGREGAVNKLERIRSGHLSSFLKSKRDVSGEASYHLAEELLSDIVHGDENLFQIELFFLIRDFSLQGLSRKSHEFFSYMSSQGISVFVEGQSLIKLKTGLGSFFNELIPGVLPKLELRRLLTKTSHLRFLLPLKQSFFMGEGISFCDVSGNEIFFNPFEPSLKNRNMLVTGLSGGGKSVFVNKLIHHLVDDHPTVILDKGGSFKKLTKYHDGIVLGCVFNPFQFKCPFYLREIILSVVDKSKFDKLERAKLLKEIKEGLREVTSFNELILFLETEFKDIGLYFEEFKNYVDEKIIISEGSVKVLYVDIENYPKSIITPLIIFVLEYFKSIKEKEKILVFDECWSFLKEHDEFIDECFRTFRKTGAFPIAISQSLKDFESIGQSLSSSITNNSYFKAFFPQELSNDHDVDDFDIENIKGLQFEKNNFSECYLKSTDNKYRKIIRTYLTPLELELFHTEAGGDKKLNSFINNFGHYFSSTKETINSYVRLKHDENNHFYMSDYE